MKTISEFGRRLCIKTRAIRLRMAYTGLLLVLLLLALPEVVQAQSYTNSYGIWGYTTTNATITITKYTGSATELYIPSAINGLPVTSIGELAFDFDNALDNVTAPNSVTNIGWEAFLNCGGLKEVTLGTNLITIGNAVFAGCTNLTAITLPDSVISIGYGAFANCVSLSTIKVPGGVASIGPGAFGGCTGLTNITVDSLNAFYSSAEGVLLDKRLTALITCPEGKGGSYTVPSTVTSIEDEAFADCTRLDGITMGNSITNIASFAFSGCGSLTNVTIPDSVMMLGDGAFEFCTSLVSVLIGKGISVLTPEVFAECYSLAKVSVPESVVSIQDSAFVGCTNLGVIILPNDLAYIASYAFESCKSLTDVTIPDSVTDIGDGAFAYCMSITNITMSGQVSDIPSMTFYACTNLKSVTIPGNVIRIVDTAFGDCTSLSGIYFKGNAPALDLDPEAPFYNVMVLSNNQTVTVYYLPGTSGWGDTFGGRPTALWLPQVQPGSFGVPTNQFGFTISWASGMTVVIEASSYLVNPTWSPISTNSLTGNSLYFKDPYWTNYPTRFYRVTWP
jgi:hypothetical protein